MFRARGKYLLFADADGATKFSDYEKLEELLLTICEGTEDISEALGIVCGSRAHMEKESIVSRSLFRTILMKGFHMVVYIFAVKNVKDTQCGFKILTRRTARLVFNSLHVERWAFDVEMLFIAQSLDIPIDEVPVNWTEIEGSKVTPIVSWVQMGIDIFMIWLKYTTGSWRVRGDMLRAEN
ncbi:Dolichyl-phosphate beta-glucosyltransferase [Armadillidium nasatum]|uniref:Dolichyl-phosphate beta-glucosyltransferase n=1 Tax=Armadillidium nasatum TaxID=96803 RepID=A0A5N5TJD9_9CRUS|nr:Dolichyl-phosphate beta-glucosyltransferase [Armadillidium nasatum]